MNAMSRNALNAYSQVGVDANVSSASPHKLISMLLDGAIMAVLQGKLYMQQGNIAAKGKSISHAIAIIDEGLKISLDEEAGGELARYLKALYEYMANRLLMANIRNDVEALDEVVRLLSELNAAWAQIGQKGVTQTMAEQPDLSSRPSMSYGKA